MKVVAVLCLLASAVYGGVVLPGPALVRTPQFDSAVIKSERLGGNFAYSHVEAPAYASVNPVVSHVQTPVVSYRATPVQVPVVAPAVHTVPAYTAPAIHAVPAIHAAPIAAPAYIPAAAPSYIHGVAPSYIHGVAPSYIPAASPAVISAAGVPVLSSPIATPISEESDSVSVEAA